METACLLQLTDCIIVLLEKKCCCVSFIETKDDSLSALDAQVGSQVFNAAIMKLLIETRQKTVVLVTHHTHLLPHADHVRINITYFQMTAVNFIYYCVLKTN